jgi:hypothetical protein
MPDSCVQLVTFRFTSHVAWNTRSQSAEMRRPCDHSLPSIRLAFYLLHMGCGSVRVLWLHSEWHGTEDLFTLKFTFGPTASHEGLNTCLVIFQHFLNRSTCCSRCYVKVLLARRQSNNEVSLIKKRLICTLCQYVHRARSFEPHQITFVGDRWYG